MENMALGALLGFLQPPRRQELPKGKFLTEAELKNIKEQRRIVEDSVRVQKMLAAAYQDTLKRLAAKYEMPGEFVINNETGELTVESGDG